MRLLDRIFKRPVFPEPPPTDESVKRIAAEIHEQAKLLQKNSSELNRLIKLKEVR